MEKRSSQLARRGFSTLPTKGVLGIDAVKEYGKGQNGLYIIRSDLFAYFFLSITLL